MRRVLLPLVLLPFGACSDPPEPPSVLGVVPDVPPTDTGADAGSDVADVVPDVPGSGETIDLVPWARLDAPLASGGGSANELRDGAAAIRDGDLQTGWLAPALGGRLVVDWQPWLGEPVPIESIRITLAQDAESVVVRLLNGCGGATVWEESVTDDEADLDPGGVVAACLETELASGRVQSLAVLTNAPVEPPAPPIDVRDPIDITHPSFGLYEDYDGPLWSWSERESVLRAHAVHGLGTYVYAPQSDGFRSSDWRVAYPDSEAASLRQLAELATALEFSLTYSIGPFDDWTDGDEATLIDKLSAVSELGITSFVITAEGLSPERVDGATGAEHVAAVEAVRAWMEGAGLDGSLVFLPAAMTDADQAAAADGPGYARALLDLPAGVSVGWSGAERWNAETTPSELDSVADALEHDPVYLDGYWAGEDVRLGTYVGRDGLQSTAPVWIRSGARPGVARFNLHQFAHWAQERPGGADGARDFAAVIEERWGVREGDGAFHADLLNEISRAFGGAGPETPRFADLEGTVDAITGDLEDGILEDRTLRDSLSLFSEMAALQSVVWHSSLSPEMVDDIWLGLSYLRLEGERGLWAMLALRERLGGRSTSDVVGKLSLLETSLQAIPPATSPDAFDRLWSAVDAADPLSEGPDVLLFYEPPDRCIAQSSLGWRPFPDADWVTIAGLPGASVEDDFVQWFAPNAGSYRAVIAATAGVPTTWNFRIVDITCGPAQQ